MTLVGPGPLPLRTARLVLRLAREDDLDDLLSYYGDPSITTYVPFEAFDAVTFAPRMQRYLTGTDPRVAGDALHPLIELDGRVVGDLMLRLCASPLEGERAPSMAEIGWVLHPAHVGHGIATEAARAVLELAFGHLGLRRVMAQLDPRNTASARICQRLGMSHEGTTRQDFLNHGEWTDTSVYGLLREEWERLTR